MHAIVHIGAPKAGSSAIQGAIQRDRVAIAEQGIYPFVPSTGPMDRALSVRFRTDQTQMKPNMRLKFDDVDETRTWSMRCWEELAQTVRRERPAFTLLSSEHFFNLPRPGEFIDALGEIFDAITVIAYVRDPVAQYASQTDQQIRGGVRLRDLKTPKAFGYYGTGKPEVYLERIGHTNMVVRNFDRANLVAGDVVADLFAQIARISGRRVAWSPPPRRANESLCGAASAWILGANETFKHRGSGDTAVIRRRKELIQRLRDAEALAGLPKLKLTDPELTGLIRHRARKKIDWINATFLKEQIPLETAAAPAQIPDDAALRARLRDWILGYLTPEHLDLVMREIVPLTGPEPAAKKKPNRTKAAAGGR